MGYPTGIDPVLPVSQTSVQATTLRTPLVGDEGLEPPHVGIKIRCLTNLANPQQEMKRGSDVTTPPMFKTQSINDWRYTL